jgi:hypothetical protein
MTVLDVLHDIAPEFTDDAKNLRFIGYATPMVSVDIFGLVYELALAYLAAHLMAVAGRGGDIAGLTNNITEGSRNIGYSSVLPKDADLMTTSYGVEYKRLLMMHGNTCFVTGGVVCPW